MWTCAKCGEQVEDEFDACWKCAGDDAGNPEADSLAGARATIDIPLTTTPQLPGYRLEQSLGIVGGEAIMGAGLFHDIGASLVDIVGGRATSYESHLESARCEALIAMAGRATDQGANAVVGVSIDYESLSGSMLMVCASGTAVLAEPVGQLPVDGPSRA